MTKESPFHNTKSPSSQLTLTQLIQMTKRFPNKSISTLLPRDYPNSVKAGYGHYVSGQMLGATASSAAGVLSMQALLHAVGLGSGAIPMAAALNWVIKDGLGQLGGVLFAANVNTKFDSDPKRWRVVSSVALDLSCFLELMTPAAPALFIPLAATANIGKNVSWLAASASRAAIHNSFAQTSNLADITAKTGTQNICASLIGTSLGIGLSSMVGSEWGVPLIISFAALSTVHLTATIWSLRAVTLRTLNPQRAGIVVSDFVATSHVNSPELVSHKENFLFTANMLPLWLHYGAPLTCAVDTPIELRSLLEHTPYLLSVKTRPRDNLDDEAVLVLLLLEESTASDFIQGLVHAHLVKRHLTLANTSILRRTSDSFSAQDGWVLRSDLINDHRHSAVTQSQLLIKRLKEEGWELGVLHKEASPLSFDRQPLE